MEAMPAHAHSGGRVSQLTASASTNSVIGMAIMCACKSAYKNVKYGNSEMGPASPGGAGISRVGVKYHHSGRMRLFNSVLSAVILATPCTVSTTCLSGVTVLWKVSPPYLL